jgi:formylglycine-generating enzyme required for sulfatase activity
MAKKTLSKDILTGIYDPEIASIKLPLMIKIPVSRFLMGTSDQDIMRLQLKESDWAYDWSDNDLFASEQPQHYVNVESFEIGQYPVTNGEYHIFTTTTGYRLPKGWIGFRFPDDMDYHPVVGVSMKDAYAYINWLNERAGMHYRLPSEAEWERSARGDDGRIYPWGNTFDPWRCNTAESAKRGTTPVGFYSPSGNSPCGAADMVGNVWEWTHSVFQPYPYQPSANTQEIVPGARYVLRGGTWYYTRKLARCAAREGMFPDHVSPMIGFRLARSL